LVGCKQPCKGKRFVSVFSLFCLVVREYYEEQLPFNDDYHKLYNHNCITRSIAVHRIQPNMISVVRLGCCAHWKSMDASHLWSGMEVD